MLNNNVVWKKWLTSSFLESSPLNHPSVPNILSVHDQITHWCEKITILSLAAFSLQLFKASEQLAFAYIKDISVCVTGWCFHYLILRTPEEPPYLMSQTFDWCASAYSGVDLWFEIYNILLWSWTRVVTSEFDLTDTLQKSCLFRFRSNFAVTLRLLWFDMVCGDHIFPFEMRNSI